MQTASVVNPPADAAMPGAAQAASAAAARRRANLLALRRIALPVLAAALVLAVWEIGTRWAQVPEVLLDRKSGV